MREFKMSFYNMGADGKMALEYNKVAYALLKQLAYMKNMNDDWNKNDNEERNIDWQNDNCQCDDMF